MIGTFCGLQFNLQMVDTTAVTRSRKIVKHKSLQCGHAFHIPRVAVLKNRTYPVDFTGSIGLKIIPVCGLREINAKGIALRIRSVCGNKKTA
jgi:hypothetical protein